VVAVRVLPGSERGAIFTLNRFTGVKGPGPVLMKPAMQQRVRVDRRTQVLAPQPEAMQMHYLSTPASIGSQNSSAIVFPFATDFAGWLRSIGPCGPQRT
jgi:hypothetical protein